EVARLEPRAGLAGIAVHRITRPDGYPASTARRLDETPQIACCLVDPHATDERHATWFVVRVEHIEQGQELVFVARRSYLDTDRVGNATQELDVSAIALAYAVAEPKHVR